jgi:hypothetical protein
MLSGYLDSMEMRELLEIWELYLERRRLEAEGDAAALAALPEVTALDGLRANSDLVSRLSVQRWIAMKDAQDQGASLEQIGGELGVTRQSAWEFMQRRIAEHDGPVDQPEPAGDPDRWDDLQRRIAEHRERTPPPDDAA